MVSLLCVNTLFSFSPHALLPATVIGCPVLIDFTWLLLPCPSSCMKVHVPLCSCRGARSGLYLVFSASMCLPYFVFSGFVCILLSYEFDLLRLEHLNIGHNSVKGHFVSSAAVGFVFLFPVFPHAPLHPYLCGCCPFFPGVLHYTPVPRLAC